MTKWTIGNIPSQEGKRAVITGATGGLGYETALGLAHAGADVILTGRNKDKGRVAVERIQTAIPTAKVRFEMLDLTNLASVRAFAARMASEGSPVHLLVNNAGVMQLPTRQMTADGFEMQFGTNHLSHFALTGLLLPLLRSAGSARVVNVSSLAHTMAKIDFDNLQGERRYGPWPAYEQSKLANLLFTFELQRRSDSLRWGLLADAAHPGFAMTDLIPNGPGTKGWLPALSKVLALFFSHSAAEGALPSLFAATSPDALPMGYYGPKDYFEMKGPVGPAKVSKRAKDEAIARRLWEVSERLTGVQW